MPAHMHTPTRSRRSPLQPCSYLMVTNTVFDKKLTVRVLEYEPVVAVVNGFRIKDYLRQAYKEKLKKGERMNGADTEVL